MNENGSPVLGGRGRQSAPPEPTAWYVHVEAKSYGPYVLADVQRMITKGQIHAQDLVFVVGGSGWTAAIDDQVLAKLFARRSGSEPRKSKISLKPAVIGIGVFAFLLLWTAWPYYATLRLFDAVRQGDLAQLETRIAWQDVRQGLRGDVNAILLKLSQDKATGEPWSSSLASLIGPVMVDRLVDSYVTPQALVLAIEKDKQQKQEKTAAAPAKNFQEIAQNIPSIDWKQVQYAFFSGSPFQFRVDWLPKTKDADNEPFGLLFSWSGDWKLTRIFLPSSIAKEMASREKVIPELGPFGKSPLTSDAGKTSEQSSPPQKQAKAPEAEPGPIRLSLVSKTFKDANYRASEYQAQILFQLNIENAGNADIRAFDGVVTFTDLLDNNIMSSKLAINELIRTGNSKRWSGAIDYNQFTDDHRRLRAAELENIKITFRVGKVLFSDGTTKEYR